MKITEIDWKNKEVYKNPEVIDAMIRDMVLFIKKVWFSKYNLSKKKYASYDLSGLEGIWHWHLNHIGTYKMEPHFEFCRGRIVSCRHREIYGKIYVDINDVPHWWWI